MLAIRREQAQAIPRARSALADEREREGIRPAEVDQADLALQIG
jgi:hypothetical protein